MSTATTTPQTTGDAADRRRRVAFGLIVAALLLLAFVARVGYIEATPDHVVVHDARDYDRHARSLATGEGYAEIGAGPGRLTAFRPPGYPYFLAGVYAVTGVAEADKEDRVTVGRVTNALIGTVIVALIGLLAVRLFDRRVALAAVGLAAIYIPLILAGGALMSEPLFAVFMLGALLTAIQHRRSDHRYRWLVATGVLAGLMVLTRTNALILLLPLAIAVWPGGPWSGWRSLTAPALLLVVTACTIAPWTIRNAVVLDAFVPVSTQFGSALAGTYNDSARHDRLNPASWRSPRRVVALNGEIAGPNGERIPEPQVDKNLRAWSIRFAADHPSYVIKVAYWNTRRALDLADLKWSRHTASTISIPPSWATAGVVCFWVFGLLAVAGILIRRRERIPVFVWAFPVLLYLSVVFMVFETPRYRTGIDPFIVLLAAVAVVGAWDWVASRVRATAPSP